MPAKPALYGRFADSGVLSIRSSVGFQRVGELIDPSTVEIRVEVWTSVAIGPEQNRCHAMEVYVPSPMTNAKYMDAYKRIVTEYEDHWKALGMEVPSNWKTDLAIQVGSAMQAFMAHRHKI